MTDVWLFKRKDHPGHFLEVVSSRPQLHCGQLGRDRQFGFHKQPTVGRSVLLALFGPTIEVLQLYPEYSRLNCIKTKVAPHYLVVILRRIPVIAQELHLLRELGIVSRHHTAIAKSAEVFGGEEAKASDVSN